MNGIGDGRGVTRIPFQFAMGVWPGALHSSRSAGRMNGIGDRGGSTSATSGGGPQTETVDTPYGAPAMSSASDPPLAAYHHRRPNPRRGVQVGGRSPADFLVLDLRDR